MEPAGHTDNTDSTDFSSTSIYTIKDLPVSGRSDGKSLEIVADVFAVSKIMCNFAAFLQKGRYDRQ
jgi:hypothetical protein